ncbi:MAG: hypothetical protein CMG39_00150 [Candidatus Marinimicrobia bacterium]|nr:hypothetical protein [Candidatus Neomarinimicrobiota bacterium]
MYFDIFIFLSLTILIIVSTLGYGLIFCNKIFLKSRYINLPFKGIFGIFFLYIISSLTHLVLPHNHIHNSLLLFFGITFFIISFEKKIIEKKQLKIIFIIFICLFNGFLISKTNEDFPYYHLPNSLQFATHKLEFGLGNLNHGFKHFSSIFIINSIFYLPYVDIYLFNITNFMLQIFFFSGLVILLKNKDLNNFTKALSSFALITFLVKFYRLSEYGADYLGQFLVLLSFIFVTIAFSKKKIKFNEKKELFLISNILIFFAATTKFLYIIYFLIPIIFIYLYKIEDIYKFILDKNFLIVSIFSISSIIFFNFTSTGCLIYPVTFTCFTNTINWSIPEDVVNSLNLHYKTWSKAGIGAGYGLENQTEYISGINWIENWFRKYFFTKVSDFMLVVASVLIVFILYFKQNFRIQNKLNFNIKASKISYLTIIIIFFVWFFNFPTLRYAGYTIVFLTLILPLAIFFAKRINFNDKSIMRKIHILLIVGIFIFNIQNIKRLNKELNLTIDEHHNFSNFPFYWVDNVDYEKIFIENKNFYKVTSKKACWNVPATCLKDVTNLKIERKNNYIFYTK